jgi:PAS domain S-box-containing protein
VTDLPIPPRRRAADLSERLREHEGLVRALQGGEVDAVVVLEPNDGARLEILASDEPLYRTIVDTLPQGVATVLADGTITYINRHLAAGIGFSAEALLGASIVGYVGDEDQRPFASMLRRAVAEPQEIHTSFRWTGGDGPVIVSASRLPISGAEALGLVVVDLRERVARQAAEEASRTKDELLASVSHEMRTPLTSIMGWVQMLEYELQGQEHLAEPLRNLKNAVLAEAKIVDDLLDLAKAEKGSLSIQTKEFDLREALRTAASFIGQQARAKSIALDVELPARQVIVRGDPDRLRQVFVNLLSNAVKFTAEGDVAVRCLVEDGHVATEIADSGMGIKPENLTKVFEPFWRSERARAYPGLGIGLAITRRLIEAHGGTIAVASDGPGKGSTFTVVLPLGGGTG